MEHSRVGLVTLALLASPLGAPSSSAAAPPPARQTVDAGKKYEAGGFTRLWLGADYRKVWATPVSVEVLDLSKEAGGLKPLRWGEEYNGDKERTGRRLRHGHFDDRQNLGHGRRSAFGDRKPDAMPAFRL